MNNRHDPKQTRHDHHVDLPLDPDTKQHIGEHIDQQVDQTIDQLLHALHSAPPPPGMERRILESLHRQQALHGAAITAVPSRFHAAFGRAIHRGPLALGALSGALALAALVFLHRPHPAAPLTPRLAAPPTANTSPLPADAAAGPTSHLALTMLPHPASAHTSPSAIQLSRSANPDALEALAVSEMNAPSLPAPPLPLTAQEKLLLRVARQNNPDPQQVFNGDLRAQQDARQTDDFLAFFGKPVPPPQDAE